MKETHSEERKKLDLDKYMYTKRNKKG